MAGKGYVGLEKKGYQREITVLRGRRKEASRLMSRMQRRPLREGPCEIGPLAVRQ
jgi:hypothetical protein